MKKFWIIFKYEFSRQVKNKVFIVITSLFIVAALVGGFIVSKGINDVIDGNLPSIDDVLSEEDNEKLYIYALPEYVEYISQIEASGMYELIFVETEEELEPTVIENESLGLIVKDYENITKIVSGTSLMSNFGQIDSILNAIYQNKLLTDVGLTPEQILNYQTAHVKVETVNVGIDGLVGYAYVYGYTMLLYMTVLIFGGIISSSVITEKTSKAMELLITSAKASSLVAGKVFAIGFSCILQMIAVISAFILSTTIFVGFDTVSNLLSMVGGIPVDLLLLALVLFIFGFFSILFLFAGFSSFATKPEDANTVIAPLMIIIIIVFMINISSMGSNLLDTTLFKGLSYVPILSPFLLFSRYALYGLSTIELLFGLFANIAGGALLILFAAKIYRAGTLHYGNSISFKKIFKSFKN